jgi:hypothetical protein
MHEAVRMKLTMQWRPQEVRDAKNLGYLPNGGGKVIAAGLLKFFQLILCHYVTQMSDFEL